MHIADFELGVLGANGVVAGGSPIAVGAGLSCKLRGTTRWWSVSSFATARRTGALCTRPEHGRHLEAPHHLRLRKQPLRLHHPALLFHVGGEHRACETGL